MMPAIPQAWTRGVVLPPLAQAAVPLAANWRGGEVESLHLGHAVLVNHQGEVLVALGQAESLIFPRSALKPIQALPLWLAHLPERFQLGSEAQAIALASHGGGRMHVQQVQAWLGAAKQEESTLMCPPASPLWAKAAKELEAQATSPTRLHHNCSGQHAMMLALAQAQGWDVRDYHLSSHPIQVWNQSLIEQMGGMAPGSLGHGQDGCGLPAWRMPLRALALAFARLGQPEGLGDEGLGAACHQALLAMRGHPELVADPDRLDAKLMSAGPQSVWATKAGAEGVHAGCIPSLGLGWAIKILDGQKSAIPAALSTLLKQAGLWSQLAHPALSL